MRNERTDSIERGLPDLVTFGVRDTQRRRNLLQCNDNGNARGESFDDGRGHVPHSSADSCYREHQQNDPGQQPDREHSRRPVFGDDRDQHHRHRTGRTRYLKP